MRWEFEQVRPHACETGNLASSDEPISAIGFAHGYQSQSHFPRAFRQRFGAGRTSCGKPA